MKQGRITPNGVVLKEHENATVVWLTENGYNVELIPPSPFSKKPDIIVDDLEWEMKSPKGNGRENLEHAFKAAVKQSENIIFDLRRSKIAENKALTKLKRELNLSKKARRLIIITKAAKRLDFNKRS
jgi:hypothetical protein